MTRGSYLFAVAVLSVFCLASAIQTQAKDQFQFQRAQQERLNQTHRPLQGQFLSTTKPLSPKIPLANLSKRNLEKRIRSTLTKCGCAAAAQDEDLSMICFTSCLKNNGVTAGQLAGCGAVCSVNLVGCAICAGINEWIALACGQYCAWRGLLVFDVGASNHQPRHPTKRPRLVVSGLQSAS